LSPTTLSLIAWLRDQSLRAPDAAIALSPVTDCTLASPSLRANVRTDVMLGPMFGPLARLPQWVLLWIGYLQTRINPCDPVVSPVRGDLANLPPTLLQACDAEMLYDDSCRYANRARAAGSPVQLQSWSLGVHAWQIFNPELTQARDALAEIGRFLAQVAPPGRKSD
jgi:monoterpene epsilon-lactone hydrolase